MQNRACIAAVVGPVQADMQNDLASPHARRLAAGEDKIDGLLEITFRQIAHIRRIPVVDLSRALRQRLELRQLARPRRLKRVRQSLDEAAAETLVDEATRLVVGYLK